MRKIIHQIWIGPHEPPEYMESWPRLNPGWEYRAWGESHLAEMGLRNSDIYSQYLSKALWSGAADVARYEILHRFGGFYADADSECLQPIETAGAWPFLVFEGEIARPGLVCNAFIACESGDYLMEALIRTIEAAGDRAVNLVEPAQAVGPYLLTRTFDELRLIRQVLPADMFFDSHFEGVAPVDSGRPKVARHIWGAYERRTMAGRP